MTRFKFCGLRDPAELELASQLGASYAGLVVHAPRSPRNLEPAHARELAAHAPSGLEVVLVTPERDTARLDELLETVEPQVLQLTGEPDAGMAARLARDHEVSVWQAVSLGADPTSQAKRLKELAGTYDAFVLDALTSEGYGGTGEQLDWTSASELVEHLDDVPVVLAGGLDADNVAEAIARVQPWCVDVSSGIEQGGAKDPGRMRAFAAATREQESQT